MQTFGKTLCSSSGCSSLLLVVLLLASTAVQATITVTGTKHKFASRQDVEMGKRLWRGYMYPARLQYIDGNLPLCPDEMNDLEYNVTVPDDGMPVALLVREGGCSLTEKAEFVLKHVRPAGLVKYLIFDGARRADDEDVPFAADVSVGLKVNGQVETDENQEVSRELESYDDDLMADWIRHNSHGSSRRPKDFDALPLYLIHVSYQSEYNLLDTLLHQTEESIAEGGPRISIDSRTGTGLSGAGVLWIAVTALVCACACSLLLFAGTNQPGWEEGGNTAPPRPTRRRLTREQVKKLLPRYHFDGQCLQHLPETTEETQDNDDGLAAPARAPPPTPLDFEMCSICLDEYEAGDRLRCLPCNHLFHSKCIGRWLAERSATCPLCKTDLWEEEEEDEESEGSVVDGHETNTAEEDIQGVRNWLDRLFGVEARSAEVAQPEAVPVTEDTDDEGETPPRPSFLRRMFSTRPRQPEQAFAINAPAAESLTEPLLQPADEEAPLAAESPEEPAQESLVEEERTEEETVDEETAAEQHDEPQQQSV